MQQSSDTERGDARDVICMTCNMPVVAGVINHVSGGYDWTLKKTLLVACPACSSETAKAASAQREMVAIARIFGEARIPWRARHWEFGNYPIDADQKAKSLIQDFVRLHLDGDQEARRMLYLGGAPGRCKTSLAICALKEALAASRSGLYVITAELMLKLQASQRQDSDYSQDELLSAVTRVQWLILDDLATESSSAYTLRSLYLIIQSRADRGLYTIFTSNLSFLDLERYWRPPGLQEGQFHEGLRITERLREYCVGCSVGGRNQRSAH